MSRPLLSSLAAAAVLLAAAPALADPAAPAAAVPLAAASSVTQAAAPSASCDAMVKKVQELEARLRASEAKVAQLVRDRVPAPPDSHAESY